MKPPRPRYKLFVIRKYVQASSVIDAIKKEKKQQVDDVWVEEGWKNAGFK